ncbi:MAG TPA: hydrogenase formation protein HypD, partial [Deltaproteobacteria bacterium]|nr:hydrogenase formation protein HypD [Deltaproteobacteria bacterium]
GVALAILEAQRNGLTNFFVYGAYKVVPPALVALASDPEIKLDGFLCPGHVSTITGTAAYGEIPARGCAAVITGFEPVDILEGIYMILGQILKHDYSVEIQYTRGVSPQGNVKAKGLIEEVFTPVDARWRGLGVIPGSGLEFRDEYREFDARTRFEIPEIDSREPAGCRCGEVLKGIIRPSDCPLFRHACTPDSPVGPCMVSQEGTCQAYYKCS